MGGSWGEESHARPTVANEVRADGPVAFCRLHKN